MQVPRFSPRISLIEMAPRPAPRSGCPARPARPCPVCHHRERAVTGRIFQALPNLLLYIRFSKFPLNVVFFVVLFRSLFWSFSSFVPQPPSRANCPKLVSALPHGRVRPKSVAFCLLRQFSRSFSHFVAKNRRSPAVHEVVERGVATT